MQSTSLVRDEAQHIRSSLTIALVFTVAGISGIAYGFATRSNPLALLPGLDGALTCGVLTLLLGLAHGLSYREAVTILVPMAAVQAGACVLSRASMPAVLGLEALIVGVIGLGLYAASVYLPGREPAPAKRRAPSRVRRRRGAMAPST